MDATEQILDEDDLCEKPQPQGQFGVSTGTYLGKIHVFKVLSRRTSNGNNTLRAVAACYIEDSPFHCRAYQVFL